MVKEVEECEFWNYIYNKNLSWCSEGFFPYLKYTYYINGWYIGYSELIDENDIIVNKFYLDDKLLECS